jgi:carbonic anhydrase
MQSLVEGVHHFQSTGFQRQRELFAKLAEGQRPEACFITCSDSRIVTSLITGAKPGQLFNVRNVGNLVPCYGTSNNGEMAAVEFAITALEVSHIIVCGHTKCGAMKGLLNPDSLKDMPSTASWLRHADATAAIIRENYGHLEGDALLTACAEENVLVQLEHLHSLPVIAARLSRGKVTLHGWMYKIETGQVFAFDSESRQFVPFAARNEEKIAKGVALGVVNGNGHKMRSEPAKKQVKKLKVQS